VLDGLVVVEVVLVVLVVGLRVSITIQVEMVEVLFIYLKNTGRVEVVVQVIAGSQRNGAMVRMGALR